MVFKLKELKIEMFGDGKSPHDPNDTWFINVDLPTQDNFDHFKVNGKTPPNGKFHAYKCKYHVYKCNCHVNNCKCHVFKYKLHVYKCKLHV